MVGAVSPASISADETISTLRPPTQTIEYLLQRLPGSTGSTGSTDNTSLLEAVSVSTVAAVCFVDFVVILWERQSCWSQSPIVSILILHVSSAQKKPTFGSRLTSQIREL